MASTPSTFSMKIGAQAPDFQLPDALGRSFTLEDVRGPQGLLVMFICNHCPYVKHIRECLSAITKTFQGQGVGVVAINSNDFEKYPDDRPELMIKESKDWKYTFPYLVDADQSVAKHYDAACTPDFFLFNSKLKLFYAGQFDSSRPGNSLPVTGEDLKKAVQALLLPQAVPPTQQIPSMGCNIKWK